MTTAEQWERLARDANAAAVKAMAEADRLRAELADTVPLAQHVETQHALGMARTTIAELRAALRAAGGQEHEDWCRYHDATGCASQPRPAAPVGGQAELSEVSGEQS